ncbi:nitrous oxidase accessory protein [Thermoplasmatales archaeon SCGC AB-540-F20]|nr:nitrous oxidase accessory protein [Thermoplasmatales archaeon SCGC AB-540-F20]
MTISSTGFNLEKQSTIATFDGNTLYVGGSGPGNYTKIQDAINDSSDGDTVFVYDDSSPYYENVVVNKSINLIGEDKVTTTIDGNDNNVVLIIADFVTISGFMIQNSGILNNGITISNSDSNTIIQNTIINNHHGIFLDESNNNNITGNNISNEVSSIFLDFSSDNNISCNDISNNFFGILMFYSKNNLIEKNNFIDNKIHAIFSVWYLTKNFWDSNYWDNWIGIGVKLIFGSLGIFGAILWFYIDWHPASEPYDI